MISLVCSYRVVYVYVVCVGWQGTRARTSSPTRYPEPCCSPLVARRFARHRRVCQAYRASATRVWRSGATAKAAPAVAARATGGTRQVRCVQWVEAPAKHVGERALRLELAVRPAIDLVRGAELLGQEREFRVRTTAVHLSGSASPSKDRRRGQAAPGKVRSTRVNSGSI